MVAYEIWECHATDCGFRFPVGEEEKQRRWREYCPRCGATISMAAHYELPEESNQWLCTQEQDVRQLHFVGLLDNIRSAWNVGSMLRSADGAGFHHLFLCGITPTPQHPKVANTSLGAENHVAWSYHPNALRLALQLKAQGKQLVALECGAQAKHLSRTSIFSYLPSIEREQLAAAYVLMVGNERFGLDPALLDLCDQLLTIPMLGKKGSLNAAVAFGIAAYTLKRSLEGDNGMRI